MQTLQSARLTSKPLPLPLFFTNSVNEKLKDFPSRPQVKAPGILRQRTVVPVVTKVPTVDTNPKTCEAIAKFFASQGIAVEAVDQHAFRELIKFLDPDALLPDEDELGSFLKKYATTHKAGVNFSKTVGPLSVTIDVSGGDDDKFLVFSIHYFEDLRERKNIIYLRKLLLSELDPASFINSIRRAVHNHNYQNVKFSNIVCPSDEIYTLLQTTPVAKRVYMCCYQYMTKFVCDVLDIDEFAGGLEELREFVRFVKETSDHYAKYRRYQLGNNGDLEVPGVDDGEWSETVLFLTKCLVLHDTFKDFVKRHKFNYNYIEDDTFCYLVYLQRLLQHCVQLCRSMSAPNSSISQVVYVYSSLKSFLTENSMGYRFQPYIRQLVDEAFKDVNDPMNERRYNIATYLDPRYAYRDTIYSRDRWKTIEGWVTDDFVNYDPSLAECYSFDLAEYTTGELQELIRQELIHYRTVSFVERPEENECPFAWWGDRQLHFAILSVMSREYLACPAVSVDAASFFTFNGKFEHITSLYNTEMLQACLTVGGNFQEFRGRGTSENKITQEMVDTLKSTITRNLKGANFDLFTHHLAATEEERNRIITSDFPPLPIVPREHHKEYLPPQEANQPVVETITIIQPPPYPSKKIPPHRMLGKPIQLNGKELKAAIPPVRNLQQGKTLPPLPSTLALKKVVPITDHTPTGLNVKPPVKNVPSTSKAASVEEEKPPKDLLTLDKEVKEESQKTDLERVKEEIEDDHIAPLGPPEIEEQKPPQIHAMFPAKSPYLLPVKVCPADSQFVRKHPTTIQHIQPHNFVQKVVVGKQNFVPKFPVKVIQPPPLPPPISIRAPIPKAPIVRTVVMPVKRVVEPLKDPKQDEEEKKPAEKDLLLESDVKLEPFDDFTPQSNYNNSYVPQTSKIYADVLNERSAAQAFERHRMNMEYHKRKPCNRRCAVCGNLEIHDLLKNVTIDNEKLLIMIGCVYRGEFSLRAAQEFMARETKTYICRVHFGETLDEIDQMLDLKDGDSVLNACSNSIQNVMMTAKQLRPHVTALSLRNMMNEFVDRNCHLRRTRNEHFNENFDFYEQPVLEEERNDVDDEAIIPKVYRQPRKQVLEADSHDGTVKVIEQEDFKLPTAKQTGNEEVQNPGVCCYCSKRGERNTMLRVPRGEDRLARWIEKLGEEFEKRIMAEEESLICRSHFPDNAFSSRGRLLKGMTPVAAPEKVVCTYSIQGNDFIKVREKKSGTDKDARVNLDSNPNGTKPFWINQYAGESSEEEEPPLPVAVPRIPKSQKKSGRPRGRPRGTTKLSIQAKLAAASRFSQRLEKLEGAVSDDDDFFYDSEFDDFEGPSDSSSEAKCNVPRLSTSPVDALLDEDDTDYALPAHFQPSDGTTRKRGKTRKDIKEEEVEDPTSRRNSTTSTQSASSRQGSVEKDESTKPKKTATRRSVPRKSADEKDEDYSVESDKPKPKKARYNVRIGGKFAKRVIEEPAIAE
ncbi:hypothetical protein CAEBREN_10324 [Caenorhabditis brenneri]|uniref:THAP-type domain-containing protein n=1 Tax=Caenorhabditis brenneri TaxID=135651 RepID=G0MAS0_CAEBE|nr:hypothetical protein CAEBREN_10324 [Caenorhabditis brenneri]